MKVYLLKTEEV